MTSLDFEAQRQKVIAPQGTLEGRTTSPRGLLPTPPITSTTFDARNMAAIVDALKLHIVPEVNLASIGRLLGLGYCFGTVSATQDTVFSHSLGRLPVLVVWSIHIDGQDGRVIGRPEAGGPNTVQWTNTAVFVRATVAGRYAFFLI